MCLFHMLFLLKNSSKDDQEDEVLKNHGRLKPLFRGQPLVKSHIRTLFLSTEQIFWNNLSHPFIFNIKWFYIWMEQSPSSAKFSFFVQKEKFNTTKRSCRRNKRSVFRPSFLIFYFTLCSNTLYYENITYQFLKNFCIAMRFYDQVSTDGFCL